MIEEQEEMKCPKCGGDMKEYATCFRCRRNGSDGYCKYVFKKYFHISKKKSNEVDLYGCIYR